jgi:hypothetical protein
LAKVQYYNISKKIINLKLFTEQNINKIWEKISKILIFFKF